jgi:hypothetical protein
MRKNTLTAIATTILFSFGACKKSDSPSSAKTVQNLSGSYVLTSLIWTSNGISANVYDSLPTCEKDNILQLLTDGTAHEIDANVKCDPPEPDSVTTWNLSAKGDSLYFGGLGTFIKSWDGKTLVYTGIVWGAPLQVIATTTLVKQ